MKSKGKLILGINVAFNNLKHWVIFPLTWNVLNLQAEIRKCQVIFVNCMALKQSQDIFRKVAVELVGEDKCPAKVTQKFLEEEFSSTTLTR